MLQNLDARRRLEAIDAEIDRMNRSEEPDPSIAPITTAKKVKIVAEGDSWFDYAPGRDIIDRLKSIYDHDVINVANAGATIDEMVYGPDNDSLGDILNRDPSQLAETIKKIRQHRPQIFLFSGGGNDIAGPEFITFLNHKNSGLPPLSQDLLAIIVNKRFRVAYETLIETVNLVAEKEDIRSGNGGLLPIIIHGYDYAFPDGRAVIGRSIIGPWFDPSFDKKGFFLKDKDDLQERRSVIIQLIDAFNEMLKSLADQYSNVFYLNLRGTLPKLDDWANELHPKNDGFKKIAGKFQGVIQQVI